MYKILVGAAALGLLALPILASAQSTNQPTTKKETAATPGTSTKKSTVANTTKMAANKGSTKQQAHFTKQKAAMHGHKMRHATAKHGKRFAKSPSRHRHVYGFSTAKSKPRASAKSGTTNARVAANDRRTSIQRRAAYRADSAATQRSCGEFMYRKDGKCNDARNKPPAK
jgi:hypothetical protein